MKRIMEYSKQLFRSKVVAYLFMATLLFSLGYFAGSSRTAYSNSTVALYSGFRFDGIQQRAADNALASAGLGSYRWVGDQLHVPRNKQHLFNYVLAKADITLTVSAPQRGTVAYDQARLLSSRMTSATERDTAAAIKWLPGITDVVVTSHTRPEWDRHVWARRQNRSVSVALDTIYNKPLPHETLVAIGRIVAPAFGITDMTEIRIVDARNNLQYDGSGEPIVARQRESASSLDLYSDPDESLASMLAW